MCSSTQDCESLHLGTSDGSVRRGGGHGGGLSEGTDIKKKTIKRFSSFFSLAILMITLISYKILFSFFYEKLLLRPSKEVRVETAGGATLGHAEDD